MPINAQPKQVTVQDIINSDERIVQLRKSYEQLGQEKNNLILEISRVEADIIANMGAFEYLNSFEDVEEARTELLPKFRTLVTKKKGLIDAIVSKDKGMEQIKNDYEVMAQEIVKELQKKFMRQSGQSGQSGEPDPQQSAPTHQCDGNCGDCKCHQGESGQQQ